MLKELGRRAARSVEAFKARYEGRELPPRLDVAAMERDLSPLTPGRGTGGFPYSSVTSYYSRYTQHWREVLLAQELYESESYASAIILNIVKFAVGKGVEVDWGDPYCQEMWEQWRWATFAPNSTYGERQRLAMMQLVRDGDIFHRWVESPEGVKVFPYDPAMFRSYGGAAVEGEQHQNGVIVRGDLTPVAYAYQPTGVPYQSLAPREPERIPPEQMIHVFKQEYDLQARGKSWLRRAFTPLEALAKYDALMLAAGEISVSSPGFWTYPARFAAAYQATDPNNVVSDAEKAIIRRIFDSRTLDDIREIQKLVEGFEWHDQKVSGIGEGAAIQTVHGMLGTRACLSVGLSPFAVMFQADRNMGFMAARHITESDKRFYELSQDGECQYENAVCERWADWMVANDPRFAQRYRGWFELWCAPQPYIDPAKDAAYWDKAIQAGFASPQEAIRASGKNPKRVMDEIMEWAEFAAEVRAKTGVDITGHKDVAADLIEALNGAGEESDG